MFQDLWSAQIAPECHRKLANKHLCFLLLQHDVSITIKYTGVRFIGIPDDSAARISGV